MIKEFIDTYLDHYNMDKDLFMSSKRTRDLVDHRMIICTVLRKKGPYTYSEIGKAINRDHASVIHHNKNYDTLSYIPEIEKLYYAGISIYNMIDNNPKSNDSLELVNTFMYSNKTLRKKLINKTKKLKNIVEEHKTLKRNYLILKSQIKTH